ncbi:MAG TPA: TonB-dependent receptor [Chitinophagaceae bacterium]|nr:TonB-dependent receptor [Chitinophagaceae bacterium]
MITGNILDPQEKSLEGATIELRGNDSVIYSTTSNKEGAFLFQNLAFGYYRLKISFVSMVPLVLDSIFIREERYEFNLSDLRIKSGSSASDMAEVVIYAERPLIQSKDGNLTFNASESPLSAGGNASDLLTSVPLITKDPSGKILVRGKEPKILIDDKPVELNLQQLQDLLESMPGSSIEKIEVLTNPPPQYANEQGGVINIVTRKGRVGKSGRISIYSGTRGESGINGSYNYRRQGLSLTINAGGSYNRYEGNGYSLRENIYTDSANFFRSDNVYANKGFRPNLRANIDYDVNKNHAFNFVLQYNGGNTRNNSFNEYRNINRFDELFRLSNRNLSSTLENVSPDLSFSYTYRSKKAGEVLRLFSNANFSFNDNDRNFVQQYFTPAKVFINDSVQTQFTDNNTYGYNIRLNYDVPLDDRKTFLSAGSYLASSNSRIVVDAASKRKADGEMVRSAILSNDFYFHQNIRNIRASLKHVFTQGFSISSGLSAEMTSVNFELFRDDSTTNNNYWSFLPFFNLNKNWKDALNLTTSYRRSIRRPGINEQNPTIDNSDPFNSRFGNPELEASMVHNIDVVLGRTNKAFYTNIGLGYNLVEDIFSQIRIPVSDSRTEISWQNISDKKEYEISTWSGYTLWNKWRMNISASYTYNDYIQNDKAPATTRFRDGSSITSNFNTSYTWKELYNVSGNLTYNRFANPQGSVRSNVSLNLGLQAKTMKKKLTITLNLIDPFNQQESRTFTYGTSFRQENYSITNTRNLRLSLSYNLTKAPPKKINVKEQLKKAVSGN